MRQVKFGRTGLFVSELCLGTMTFGGDGIWKPFGALGQADAESLIGQSIDAGINLIDTADVYSAGRAEQMIGKAIRNLKIPRENVIIATKGLGETGKGPNSRGMSRHHLTNAVHNSLQRLQVDYIDLYQIHGVDPATPIEEALHALERLVQAGLIRYIGVSNWSAWQVAKALGIAERRGHVSINCLQAYYTIAARELERELAPMALSEQLALMVWAPLAGGLLSGKYRSECEPEKRGRRKDVDFPPVDAERIALCIDGMKIIAAERGLTIAQVALAWLLHQPVVTSVIIGARRADQLEENILATAIRLERDELDALSALSPPNPEYPGWSMEKFSEFRLRQMKESRRG